jgi:hypothetical protein
MDPDANMREQNEIVARMRRGEKIDHDRYQELRTAMREWLARGGFPSRVKAI